MKNYLAVSGLALALVSALSGCRAIEAIEPIDLSVLADRERAQVDLGQALFFDPQLSSDGLVSCASCHVPSQGGDDDKPVAVGVLGQTGPRNSPTVLNVGFKELLFWDGRASTLEEQALMPLFADNEMAADEQAVLDYLGSDARYQALFTAAYSDNAVSLERVAQAIASYERALVAPSRVDRYLLGDEAALNATEQRGLDFFQGNCAFCHDGPGVGGRRFEVLGDEEPWPEAKRHDRGLFELTGDPDDEMVFVVPQLRNVSRTAPYFHDGSVETLAEAVELMGRHQLGEELTQGEIDDLVAFLEALEGEVEPALLAPPSERAK
jgi:cytochrome c peroxidase